MIDSDNLRTASLYINNQLLSRGLLRDGQNIDFADPDAGEGLQGTMGKIMGVVNDLILRRDRDAVHRESLSNTLLSLRADNQRHTTETTRLSEKLAETQRKLDGADAVERTLRLQVRSTETTVHKLKDEIAKTKSLVAQGRAACANEVRKRDRQIESLKKAVIDAGRVRGGNKSRDVVSITVVGEVGAEVDGGIMGRSTDSEHYSLRVETNEFLTELAKSLSEENSTLLNLVHRTVQNLRDMSGLQRTDDDHMSVDGRGGYHAPQGHRNAEELASELEGILEHLRTILTNPSFVPIEEVEIRETEIARLREGWERMEARWKDAVNLMDSWRRRMASSGKPVEMEELQMGMRLSPVRVTESRNSGADMDKHYQDLSCVQDEEEEDASRFNSVEYRSQSESLHLVPAPIHEQDPDDDSESSIFQDDVDMDELEVEEPNFEVLQESTNSTTTSSPPLPIPPHLSPLKDSYSSANRGSQNSKSRSRRSRPGAATTVAEEASRETANSTNQPPAPPPHGPRPQKSSRSLRSVADSQELLKPSTTEMHESTLFGESYESPIRSNPSRKLFSGPAPKGPDLGVEQKSLTTRDIPRSQQPTQSSTKKHTSETTASTTEPPKPTSSSTRPRKAAKRTASAPDATKKQASTTAKPASKSTGANIGAESVSNIAPERPPSSARTSRVDNPPVQPSPITMASISAKLEASERQADAARVRAKLRAARTHRKPEDTSTVQELPEVDERSTDPVKRDIPHAPAVRLVEPEDDEFGKPAKSIRNRSPKSEKRKRERRPSKVISRRRSTLSPWELESLIQGQVESVASPAR
ncbi:hypothetical protein E8E14_010421 [Neopestalotiopsis sp. 37M]|nr:hypothetical protein E8E14_010421 [Neopestalotiopsis sp. 37M]